MILQGWPIEYFQEGATVVKFHFTNWIGRHQISKSREANTPRPPLTTTMVATDTFALWLASCSKPFSFKMRDTDVETKTVKNMHDLLYVCMIKKTR